MVKLKVLYEHPDDPDAFEDYYANTHLPRVQEIPNLLRYEAAKAVATPDGSAPPFYRIFEGYFEGMEELQSGMSGLRVVAHKDGTLEVSGTFGERVLAPGEPRSVELPPPGYETGVLSVSSDSQR